MKKNKIMSLHQLSDIQKQVHPICPPTSKSMTSLVQPSASLVAATMPSSTAAKVVLVAFTLACFARPVSSPERLTRVLVSAISAAEDASHHIVEAGYFHREYAALTKRLTSLQVDVSLLREAALRDSRSSWAPFSQRIQFRRMFAILRCIREVQALKTDIEILKECQLRELPLETAITVTARTISMRRRPQISTSSPGDQA
ncbi:hypothetical protein B0H11DRAFT_2109278 [Mycena galericulata]|nr:hypothetical protein B0H11DRAFT_2109278 [Mycena galericulata]